MGTELAPGRKTLPPALPSPMRVFCQMPSQHAAGSWAGDMHAGFPGVQGFRAAGPASWPGATSCSVKDRSNRLSRKAVYTTDRRAYLCCGRARELPVFIRRVPVKGNDYFVLVESYRDDAGMPRHRTLLSLGRHATTTEALASARLEFADAGMDIDTIINNVPAKACKGPVRIRLDQLKKKVKKLESKIDILHSINHPTLRGFRHRHPQGGGGQRPARIRPGNRQKQGRGGGRLYGAPDYLTANRPSRDRLSPIMRSDPGRCG